MPFNQVKSNIVNFAKHCILLILMLFCFNNTVKWLFDSIILSSSSEYRLLFLIITAVIIVNLRKIKFFNLKKLNFSFSLSKFTVLIIFLTLNSVNTYFFHSNIISGICLLFSSYFLAGFYLQDKLWKRGFYLVLLLSFTLPLLHYVQIFLGFPIRLLTAKIISGMFSISGIKAVSESTIILLENNMTSIDYPCSGIKSFYIGTIFMLLIYFLKNAKISLQMFVTSLLFFFMIMFFNTWRVFSLILVNDVFNLPEAGAQIHTLLGIIGFIISCLILWYLTERFIPVQNTNKKTFKNISSSETGGKLKYFSVLFILLFFLILNNLPFKTEKTASSCKINLPHNIGVMNLTEIEMTDKETLFYKTNTDISGKKYIVKTVNGQSFSLLITSGKSWRLQHNPEVCIQGQGYIIQNSKIVKINGLLFKKLTLNNGKNTVLYLFSEGNKTSIDYSERVWSSILYPNKYWTLILIGFDKPINLNQQNFRELINIINNNSQHL